MKVSDLRIGNYCVGYSFKVEVWTLLHFKQCEDGSEEVTPIPLTEEWLVKLGVDDKNKDQLFDINYCTYHKGTNTFNYIIGYYFNNEDYVDYVTKEIQYVHQLQNLYFALTNTELTINA
jgi:hypothetical protein